MSIRADGIAIGTLRRWVAHLLLFAFALRALIPAGYMPDFSATSRGSFKVVICTTASASSVAMKMNLGDVGLFDDADSLNDSNNNGAPHPLSKHSSDSCAFTGIASLALPDLEIAPAARLDFAAIKLTPAEAAIVPPARAGPALGARAPPKYS